MNRNNDPRCGAAGGEQKDNSSESGLGGEHVPGRGVPGVGETRKGVF